MKSVFRFKDISYYVSNGCDCCEPEKMEAWESEDVSAGLGTPHSREECIIQAINTVLDERNGEEVDCICLYSLSEYELSWLCTAMGIGIKWEKE